MNEPTPLTAAEVSVLWALDFDTCMIRPHLIECTGVATHKQVCQYCGFEKYLCIVHANAVVQLIRTDQHGDGVSVWRCDACRRCSAGHDAIFHLHTTKDA